MRRAIAIAALVAACSPGAPTQLVVVVESDLPVPSRLASVRAAVGESAQVFPLPGPEALPFSFGIEPRGGDASRPVHLVLEGRDAAGVVFVTRTVRTGFRPGRTTLLRAGLEELCADAPGCAEGTTCIEGACVDDSIAPAALPEVEPGQELGPPADAGVDTDAGAPVPRSCEELRDLGGATGVHTIDPDGPGGAPRFHTLCENDADGGGWTLIAKVDPASPELAFGSRWEGLLGRAFGEPLPLTSGEALLASYWTLPVDELRIGMIHQGVERWATATLSSEITLRNAMRPAFMPVRIETLDLAGWFGLLGQTPTMPPCSRAMLGAIGPNAGVRIGVVFSAMTPCDRTTPVVGWIGAGSTSMATPQCDRIPITAGGARLCGSPDVRMGFPAFTIVMGR
jgi:hypothetical protein